MQLRTLSLNALAVAATGVLGGLASPVLRNRRGMRA